jgi:hypothetical protein
MTIRRGIGVALAWLCLVLMCYAAASMKNEDETRLTLHKRVEAAVILDEKHKLNARGRRRYAHCREFMNTLFKHNNLTITVDPPPYERRWERW